jgi:hypothetical protein
MGIPEQWVMTQREWNGELRIRPVSGKLGKDGRTSHLCDSSRGVSFSVFPGANLNRHATAPGIQTAYK